MKKRYWAMLAGAYAAAIIGYFVYESVRNRRETEDPVTITPICYTTDETETTLPSTCITVKQTTAVSTQTTEPSTAAATSTAAPTTQTTAQTTITATSIVTTTMETTTTTATTTTAVTFPVNLNTATIEQLTALPGIGEALAQAILERREILGGFTNRRQLQEIPGIGEGRFDEISGLLYIEDEQPLTEPTTEATAPIITPVTQPPETQPTETEPLVINLNTASKSDLLRLPGCDDAAADSILWLRGEIQVYHNPAELLLLSDRVPGIGSLYEQWKDCLFVDDNGAKQLP